ncbi:type II toxin-antitoxin system VapC family toxin [Candidatus Manganitrophus noduliformans]|uniref:Type II toxin-antitoxin system VapC family toxin n=1 Tax=Candidatus Manganitrophus noduliformans TaxID=2606439 RepID=A0A7X6IDK5_9BACT|nr:type II toxin-antitoxin system VapC family toxin [Candidatus Manganitrophus noduliformans]NKE73626.1 type II toxin-antitoxin system VapC family toxin [Candidatus Manganitrophus noduliformans]
MRLLLDTHLMLWWLTGDRRLPKQADQLIADSDNEVYVSAASIWEVAIKSALGRIEGDVTEIEAALGPSGFLQLPINGKHAAQVSKLPPHHQDPFDRMLVAQSLIEPMRLLTHDRTLAKYGEMVILT